MKKKRYVALVVLLIILCSACNNEELYEEFTIQEDEKILLYHIFSEKLGIYDMNTFEWNPLYPQDNIMQYVFQNESSYIVSGHSVENGFVLLKISEDRKNLKKVFELSNSSDYFFPLTDDGSQFYYVLVEDEKDIQKTRESIFTFDENFDIQIIYKSRDKIMSGLIIDRYLYYTVYNQEKDSYSVYTINLDDKEKKPGLIKDNLESRDLFNINNHLYFSSRDKIFNDKQSFEKKMENFFVENLLIQFYDDKNLEPVCTITDIRNNQILNTYKYPVNFAIKDQILYLFTEEQIFELPLGV